MGTNFSLEKFKKHHLLHHEPAEHSLEAWQAWFAELPILNTGKASTLLQKALHEATYNHPADPQKWFEIIELFRPAITAIKRSVIENHLTAEASPLSKKIIIVGLIQTLKLALVDVYSLIARSADQTTQKELIALAIHRAINYLLESLLLSYQVYSVPAKGIWLKLHSLYQLAKELDITDYFAHHPLNTAHANKTSILGSYLKGLLLPLANFYQLDFPEMEKIFNILNEWAIKAVLRNDAEGLYIVYTTRDEPPVYQKLVAEINQNEPWLSIDTAPLLTFLERLVDNPEQNTQPSISANLLQHLIRSWGNLPARAFPRIKQNSNMRICIGLSAVHHFITESKQNHPIEEQAQEPKQAALFTLSEIDNSNEESALRPGQLNNPIPEPDVWEPDFLLQKQDEAFQADKANIKPKYVAYEWKVIDSSPAGYGLYSTLEQTEAIKVGEIIGLQPQEDGSKGNWLLGVIRWLKMSPEGALLLGIQLLSTNAIPVRLQMNEHTKPLRALMINESYTDEQPTILTLNIAYLPYTPMTLHHDNTSHMIEFIKQLNHEGRYKQFEFKIKI